LTLIFDLQSETAARVIYEEFEAQKYVEAFVQKAPVAGELRSQKASSVGDLTGECLVLVNPLGLSLCLEVVINVLLLC